MASSYTQVRGVSLDPHTRCEHYGGLTDIIAIQMKCCGEFYACKDCHLALADHPIVVWSTDEWDEEAVRCGSCGRTLTIRQYLGSGNRCPGCEAAFNPKCRNHYHYYFEGFDPPADSSR